MSVNVSKNDIDRLVRISRSYTSNNEKMKVLFTRVDPFPACFCTSFQWFLHAWWHTRDNIYITNDKQATHKSNVTQPRLIKTKLEDALMSGQHDAVSYIGDPLNLTILSLLTARTAWTFRNFVIPLVVFPLETLFKHHVLSVVAPLVRKSLFRLSRRQLSGWIVTLTWISRCQGTPCYT